jgi:GST-like protein
MITLYYHPSPNPEKVVLFLEETGLPYDVVPIDTRKGEQLNADFLKINPNGKTPALMDGDIRVFDSNAILLYLAEKVGQFLPDDGARGRAELLSWLMFVATGIGPYCGQAVHFTRFAPKGLDYAVERYQYEARRHWSILDDQLSERPFVLGTKYTIVDMAAWGWARRIPFIFGDEAWKDLPHLKRWFEVVDARPAAKRALALKDRFVFKTEVDAEARRLLFRHIKPG